MTDLTGKLISGTYQQLLLINSSTTNEGVGTSIVAVQTGDGTNTALKVATNQVVVETALRVNGTATITNDLVVSDRVCASAFFGDGSNLTGLTASIGGDISVNSITVAGSANVGGSLVVKGDTSVSGALNVAGNASLGGTLTQTGVATFVSNVTVGGKLVVEGDVSVSGQLDVNENVSIGGTLAVTGTAAFTSKSTFSNDVSVSGRIDTASSVSVGSVLNVTGISNFAADVSVSGKLNVVGNVTASAFYGDGTNLTGVIASIGVLPDSVSISGFLNVGGTLAVVGNTSIGGTLIQTGAATFDSNVSVSGTLNVAGNTSIGGTLIQTGAATFASTVTVVGAAALKSNVTVGGTLDVAGNTSVGGTLFVTGAGTFDSTVSISAGLVVGGTATVVGAMSIGGALSVGGATNLLSTVTVVGATGFLSTVRVSGAATMASTLDVAGNVSVGGTIFATGDITFDGDVSVSGDVNIGGNVGIGISAPRAPLHVQPAGGASDNFNVLVSQFRPNIVLEDLSGSATDFQFFVDANGFQIRSGDASTDTKLASELVHITSAGLVGIGTSSPSGKLNVASGSSGASPWANADDVVIETNGATGISILAPDNNQANLIFGSPSDNIGSIIRWVHDDNELQVGTHKSNGFLTFKTAIGTERMRIDSSGNVGIGTSSPATKFHVLDGSSSLRFRQNGTVAETLTIGPSGGDAAIYLGDVADTVRAGLFYDTSENDLQIRGYNNSTRMIIDSSGNVGIGALTPDRLFEVEEASGDAYIRLRASDTGGGADTIFENLVADNGQSNYIYFGDLDDVNIGIIRYSHASDFMSFTTNASERMRITSAGNVGIGTTSPAEKLEVTGNIILDATNADIKLKSGGGGTTGALRWTFTTNSTSYGDISLPYDTRASVGLLLHTIGGYPITIDTGNSVIFKEDNIETMRIAPTGRVGIGTASPSTLLHLASTGNAILTLEADTDNVTESDNARIELSQDGGATTGHLGYGNNTNGIDIWNDFNDYVRIGTNNIERLRIVNNGVVRPATDNVQPLGAAANRWSVVYAGTGTINTSDEREKQQIADLDDAERRVAVAIKGLVKKYKYNDAVALKGDDARIHVGVIAQEVIAAFAAGRRS